MLNMNIDLSSLANVSAEMTLDLNPLQQGLVEAARFVRDEWIQAVSGGSPLPGMTHSIDDDKYAAALKTGESMQFPRILHAIVMPVNYQDEVSKIENGIPAYDMKCIVDSRAKVLTIDGWKEIRNIVKGDLVLSHRGKFRRVLGTRKERLEKTDIVMRIKFVAKGHSDPPTFLRVTSNHPFLINGEWKMAKDIKPGMKLKMLAFECANPKCSNLAPYYNETCSRSCARSISNIRAKENGKHPMQKDENRKRQSEFIKEKNREFLQSGTHVSLRDDLRKMWKEKAERGEHPLQKYMKEHGEELLYLSHQALGRKHHGHTTLEDKMNSILNEIGFTTSWAHENLNTSFIRQHKIVRHSLKSSKGGSVRNRWYFADFADPINKVIIECNGERFHSPEKDASRTKELESMGWRVLAFYSKQIYRDPESVKSSICALYGNHNENYQLMDVECTSVEIVENSPCKHKYDLEVEEDHSFICNGIAVHNSGLLNGPKSKPLKDGNGRYNTVPFRHYSPARPGSGASGISIRMRMPNEVYNSAKALDRSVPNPNTGKMDWGMSLDWNENIRTRPSPDPSRWQDYTHKNDIYDGMYRVGYERHTQYLTFRRVSTPRTKTFTRGPRKGQTVNLGSDPNSWIHPAIPPNPVVQAVYNYCMPQVEQMIQEIVNRMLG